MNGLFLWQKVDCVGVRKVPWGVSSRSSVTLRSSYLWRRSSMLERPVAGDRREVFLLYLPSTLCSGRLPKRARKNSSLEEDGINALCLLIGLCVAESLGGGFDSWEKTDLWLHSLLEWSFPRNKSKIKWKSSTENYQVKQLKENSTENSAEKNFKED